jgi:hypothetical protein
MRRTFNASAPNHTGMPDERAAAIIDDRVETMRDHHQRDCMNRWRQESSTNHFNALNQLGNTK